jgi:hypothetical protein
MTVTVQSSNLSSFSPKFLVYTSSLSLVNQASAPNSFGATITTTASVTAGQSYYIKVLSAGGPGSVGGYGLLVNFGNQAQAPIPPPNTVVASQPDLGGGTVNDGSPGNHGNHGGDNQGDRQAAADASWIIQGSLTGWGDQLGVSTSVRPQSAALGDAPVGNPALLSGAPLGPIGVVPAEGHTPAPILVSPGIDPAPVPSAPAAVTLGPVPSVLQALDDVLASWSSPSKDPIGS